MNNCDAPGPNSSWDAGDLGCGELMIELRLRIKRLKPFETLHLIATDLGAKVEIPAWCRLTGNRLKQADHPNYLIERKET